MSLASAPEIKPADKAVIAAFESVNLHPEFVLSRRELIRYVLSEPGQRSKEVQSLLRLDDIEKLRGCTTENRQRLHQGPSWVGACGERRHHQPSSCRARHRATQQEICPRRRQSASRVARSPAVDRPRRQHLSQGRADHHGCKRAGPRAEGAGCRRSFDIARNASRAPGRSIQACVLNRRRERRRTREGRREPQRSIARVPPEVGAGAV